MAEGLISISFVIIDLSSQNCNLYAKHTMLAVLITFEFLIIAESTFYVVNFQLTQQ